MLKPSFSQLPRLIPIDRTASLPLRDNSSNPVLRPLAQRAKRQNRLHDNNNQSFFPPPFPCPSFTPCKAGNSLPTTPLRLLKLLEFRLCAISGIVGNLLRSSAASELVKVGL